MISEGVVNSPEEKPHRYRTSFLLNNMDRQARIKSGELR